MNDTTYKYYDRIICLIKNETIVKLIKHQPEDKCVSVKYVDYIHISLLMITTHYVLVMGVVNFTDNETFIDSLVQKSKHRVRKYKMRKKYTE